LRTDGVGIMCLRKEDGTVQNLEVSIPFVERIEGMKLSQEFEAFLASNPSLAALQTI